VVKEEGTLPGLSLSYGRLSRREKKGEERGGGFMKAAAERARKGGKRLRETKSPAGNAEKEVSRQHCSHRKEGEKVLSFPSPRKRKRGRRRMPSEWTAREKESRPVYVSNCFKKEKEKGKARHR